MKRFLLVVVAILGASSAGACNKPSTEDCRLAVAKVRALKNPTPADGQVSDNEGEVRRCRGGSTREYVACVIKAESRAELDACDAASKKSP